MLKIENRKLVCEHCLLSRRNINRHSFAFSFGCVGAKEKASQKEKRRFSGALPLLTPPPFEKGGPKLSLIALYEMYKVPDRIVWSGYVCAFIACRLSRLYANNVRPLESPYSQAVHLFLLLLKRWMNVNSKRC